MSIESQASKIRGRLTRKNYQINVASVTCRHGYNVYESQFEVQCSSCTNTIKVGDTFQGCKICKKAVCLQCYTKQTAQALAPAPALVKATPARVRKGAASKAASKAPELLLLPSFSALSMPELPAMPSFSVPAMPAMAAMPSMPLPSFGTDAPTKVRR